MCIFGGFGTLLTKMDLQVGKGIKVGRDMGIIQILYQSSINGT